MDHNNCFPRVLTHTHSLIRSIYTKDLRPSNCEALIVTTTYPVKNFMCKLLLHPAVPGNQVIQRVMSSVRPRKLTPKDKDVMLSRHARRYVSQHTDFADDLKCRILFWNCSGICHCRFREAVRSINNQYGVDIAIVVGGPPHDETTDDFWLSVGLGEEGIPYDFNFEGSGPPVTVRYDESLMDVDYCWDSYDESLMEDDGRRELQVSVYRPLYVRDIEYALAHNMVSSSEETDSEADDSE